MTAPPLPTRFQQALNEHQRGLIEVALSRTGGNIAQAARQLGCDRRDLWRRMRVLGMPTRAEDV